MERANLVLQLARALAWNIYVLQRGLPDNHAEVAACVRRDLGELQLLVYGVPQPC